MAKKGDSMIVYTPLWDTMKRRGVSQYSLIKNYNFSKGTLDSLKQNRNVTIQTINDLCTILECRVEDIMVFIPNSNEVNGKNVRKKKSI